ncbi:hypothetical protein MG293_015244 [Ovis ammon polii]|uniref:Uncharacterized protein n=1 Tax=Ovis ammon polii TaxID=230172 RepID=A0AAD4Y4A6_OVIAM|nr:hypothetical protein MG293_015244 [Ovis ammon polii]
MSFGLKYSKPFGSNQMRHYSFISDNPSQTLKIFKLTKPILKQLCTLFLSIGGFAFHAKNDFQSLIFKNQWLPLAQRPVPTEHLSGSTATQTTSPGSRPLLGTEQCHGGDDGLCLAGCESIRCADSNAAESSLKENK